MTMKNVAADLAGAQWIWAADADPNGYVHARRRFSMSRVPERATLAVTADSRYAVWLNGHEVGRGPGMFRRPGFRVDTFDVTRLLIAGENVLCVLGCYIGIPTHNYDPGPPGILCRLAGPGLDIVSDPSWRVRLSQAWQRDVPRKTWALGATEVFDARRDDPDWLGLDFDDSAWETARVVDQGRLDLLARSTPPFESFFEEAHDPCGAWLAPDSALEIRGPERELFLDDEPLRPCAIPEKGLEGVVLEASVDGSGQALCYDMGVEMCGHIEFELTAPAGARVDCVMVELLRAGRPWCHRKRQLYAMTYVTRAGRQKWRNFHWNAGRYVYLVFRRLTEPVHIHHVGVWRRHARLSCQARFESSDETLDRIFRTGWHTIHMCSHSAQVDCPSREQASYWGDGAWMALWTAWLAGDASFLRLMLESVAYSQDQDGRNPSSLYTGFTGRGRQLVDYSLIMVMAAWEYWWLTADRAVVECVRPYLDRTMNWFRGRVGPSGLIETNFQELFDKKAPDTLFVDHPGIGFHNTPGGRPGIDRNGVSGALNAMYVMALKALADLDAAFGRPEAARATASEADRMIPVVHRTFWLPERGIYVDAVGPKARNQVSQHTNALMALAGVCPASAQPVVLRRVLDESDPSLCVAGPYFWAFIGRAMARAGMQAEALAHIRCLWTPMLDAGATTWWETFLGDELDSLCHGWSSMPSVFLLQEIAGVQATQPGFGALRFSPRIDLLDRVTATVPLPQGAVTMAWSAPGPGQRELRIELDADVSADIELPEGWAFAGRGSRRTSARGPVKACFRCVFRSMSDIKS